MIFKLSKLMGINPYKITETPLTSKIIFGGDTAGELHIELPSSKIFKEQRAYYGATNYRDSYSKDWFQAKYDPLIRLLSKGTVKLVVHADKERADMCADTLKKVMNFNGNMLKDVYVSFAAIMRWSLLNAISMINYFASETEKDLLCEITHNGGISMDEVCRRFNFKISKSWYWRTDEKYKDFYKSKEIPYLREYTRILESSADFHVTASSGTTDYLIPDFIAITFSILRKYNGDLTSFRKPEEQEGCTVWSMTDEQLADTAITLKGMIMADLIVNGKSKIPVAVIKKVAQNIHVPQLPSFSTYDNNNAAPLLAVLALKADKTKIVSAKTPDKVLEILSEKLHNISEQLLLAMLSESISKPSPSLLASLWRRSENMMADIRKFFVIMKENDTDWVSTDFFYDRVMFLFADEYNSVIFSDSYYRSAEYKSLDKHQLTPMQIKKQVIDVIIHGVILCFAALGGLELQVSESGKVTGIRLTPMGRWYVGDMKKESAPLNYSADSTESFDIDDKLMMITARTPNSPFIPMLKEYGRPVGSTRFVLTRQTLMEGCADQEELKNKISNLKTNIIGKPGPVMEAFFNSLLDRYGKVKPTPGGSTYKLFDIDAKVKELRDLILTDSDIMKNSLKVEGGRLLVKTSYLPNFYAKLRSAGYPPEL